MAFDPKTRLVVRDKTKIACLPVGKYGEDDWITGTWHRIQRDEPNNCWLVDLEPTAAAECGINSPSRRETPLPREGT